MSDNVDENDRHYFQIEVVDQGQEYPAVIERFEAEDADELARKIDALDELDMLQHPFEVQVCQMSRLDAPLSDEEQQELDDWIDSLAEENPAAKDDGGSADYKVRRATMSFQEGTPDAFLEWLVESLDDHRYIQTEWVPGYCISGDDDLAIYEVA